MRFPYIPLFLQRLLPKHIVCSLPCSEKTVYITFDDGPTPETTPALLEILRKYDAKATFFCVGENVKQYPGLFQQLLDEKHVVGNHTMHHLHGWKTPCRQYTDDINEAHAYIESPLFRPPYGKITWRQFQRVKHRFRVVLWTVMSYDFDNRLTPDQCFQYAVRHTKDGDILVFHDSKESFERTSVVLEKTLAHFHRQGFCFNGLEL